MVSTWDLIKSGNFEEACKIADGEASTTGELALRNKVFALLHLKRTREAITLCEELIKRVNGASDSDFIKLGVAHWLTNNRDQAVESWQRGLDTKYTDAAGGIRVPLLLYYASVRISDEKLRKDSAKRLGKLSKGKSTCNWPGPLGSFLLDVCTESSLFATVTKNPVLRERQLCQAHFYVGVKCSGADETDRYRENMRLACSRDPVSYLEAEYYLSKAEYES